MIEFDCEGLRSMGLTARMIQQAEQLAQDSAEHTARAAMAGARSRLMRLTEVHRESLRLHDGQTILRATVATRLVRQLADSKTALTVGDWVLAAPAATDQLEVVHRLRPSNQIVRRESNGMRHPLVSNVDCALLTMGLDKDFNPRRVERFIALVQDSGATPVIVLTKADTVADSRTLYNCQRTVRDRIGSAVPILCVDGRDADTADRLQAFVQAGQTLVLLGTSGAGKSTLANTLLGRAAQDTGPVREHDSRGKHSTRTRTLLQLPGGACIIDTPGLRALRVDADEQSVAAAFGEIEELASGCRFSDCKHQLEPGCRVRAEIDEDRLHNYQKLLREARRDSITVLQRRQQLLVWKARTRARRRDEKEQG